MTNLHSYSHNICYLDVDSFYGDENLYFTVSCRQKKKNNSKYERLKKVKRHKNDFELTEGLNIMLELQSSHRMHIRQQLVTLL